MAQAIANAESGQRARRRRRDRRRAGSGAGRDQDRSPREALGRMGGRAAAGAGRQDAATGSEVGARPRTARSALRRVHLAERNPADTPPRGCCDAAAEAQTADVGFQLSLGCQRSSAPPAEFARAVRVPLDYGSPDQNFLASARPLPQGHHAARTTPCARSRLIAIARQPSPRHRRLDERPRERARRHQRRHRGRAADGLAALRHSSRHERGANERPAAAGAEDARRSAHHGGARAGSARHLDPRAAAARLARAVRQRPRRDVLDRHLSPADARVAGGREPVRPTRPGRAPADPRATRRRQSPSPERWNGLAAGPPVRVRPRRQRLRRDAHHRRHREHRGRHHGRRGHVDSEGRVVARAAPESRPHGRTRSRRRR